MRVASLGNSHRLPGLKHLSSELPNGIQGHSIKDLERLVSPNVKISPRTSAEGIRQNKVRLSAKEGAQQTNFLKMSLRREEDSRIGVKEFRQSLEKGFNGSNRSIQDIEATKNSLERSYEQSAASPESSSDWFSAIRAQRLAQKPLEINDSPPISGDVNMPAIDSSDLPKWEAFNSAEKLTQAFVRLQANPRLSAEVKTEMNNAVGEKLFKLAFVKSPENLPQVLTGYEQFASTNQGSTMLDFFSLCVKNGSVPTSFARTMAPSASTLSEPVRQLLGIYHDLSGRDLTHYIDGNHDEISPGNFAFSEVGMKALLSGKHDELIEQASKDPFFAVYARSMPEFQALAARLVKEGIIDKSTVVDLQAEAKPVKYTAYSGEKENTFDKALWKEVSGIPLQEGSISDVSRFVDIKGGTVVTTDLKDSTPSSQKAMKAVQEASLAILHIISKHYGEEYIHQFNGDSSTAWIPGNLGAACKNELAAWQARTQREGFHFRLGFVELSEERPLSVGRNNSGVYSFKGLERFDTELKAADSEIRSGEVRTVDPNPTKKPDGIYLRVAPEVTKNGAREVVNMMIPLRTDDLAVIEKVTAIIHKIVGKEASQVFGPGIMVGTPEGNSELRIRNFGQEMEGSFKDMNAYKVSYTNDGMALFMPQFCATKEQVAQLKKALELEAEVIGVVPAFSEHATVYSANNGKTWETLQSTLFRASPALKALLKQHVQEQEQQLNIKREMESRESILARQEPKPSVIDLLKNKLSATPKEEPQKISAMKINQFRQAWRDGRRRIQEGITSGVTSRLDQLIAAQNASFLINNGLTTTKPQSSYSSNTA
jgi:hypothetical protein